MGGWVGGCVGVDTCSLRILSVHFSQGIGCYMFRINSHGVVDATMSGNEARFINHACEVSV